LNFLIKWLKSKFSLPSRIRGVEEFFRKNNSKTSRASDLTILVQNVEDPYYFCLFGSIVSKLNEHGYLRVEQYISRSFHVNESKNIIRFFLYRLSNLVLGIKWVNAYKSYSPFIGYKFLKFNFIYDLVDAVLAFKCFMHIKSHDNLIALKLNNVLVGDLINDTYLRFKPSPKINLKDPYLLFIIWHAHRSIRGAYKYFLHKRPHLFLTSYSTYLQHGIAVRVALLTGVKVYSFGNYQQFAKKLTANDFYHTKNPSMYKLDFSLLPNKDDCLLLAEESFQRKIAGEVDHHFSYMKNSAYAVTEQNIPNVQGASIIFLHDFFDSPHVYPCMVFHDFWDWICFTIECLESKKIKYYIKPHPNQIGLNDEVIIDLIRKYPDLKFTSPKVTNTQLIDAGISSAITVYGSVAHEMAYFGIPSIACARHPHIAYSFCQTASSREEYKKLIYSSRAPQNLDVMKMRKESLEFYFMHNLNLTTKESELMLSAHNLRSGCAEIDQGDAPDLVGLIENLSSKEAFKDFCNKIIHELSCGNNMK
jgi:hypothetical protein